LVHADAALEVRDADSRHGLLVANNEANSHIGAQLDIP
jgi:hypothetical protein